MVGSFGFGEFRWQVLFDGRRINVADKHEDDAVYFLDWIGFVFQAADMGAFRVGQDLYQCAIPYIKGKTM